MPKKFATTKSFIGWNKIEIIFIFLGIQEENQRVNLNWKLYFCAAPWSQLYFLLKFNFILVPLSKSCTNSDPRLRNVGCIEVHIPLSFQSASAMAILPISDQCGQHMRIEWPQFVHSLDVTLWGIFNRMKQKNNINLVCR